MISRPKLLRWAQAKKEFHAKDVARHFRVSRQTASFHLKRLVEEQLLHKTGSTRNATYSLRSCGQEHELQSLKLVKKTSGLKVDLLHEEILRRFPLRSRLSRNVQEVFNYVFYEMLSNVVLHSGSRTCRIGLKIERGVFRFSIEDGGRGVFQEAQKKFELEDECSAAYHLFRNRRQIFSDGLSAQWIYMSSKLADRFVISSHKVVVKVDNEKKDFIILENRFHQGTRIEFSIKARSKRKLRQFFQEFQREGADWQTREARIQLLAGELMSRVQARRFVAGLEGLKKIVFDFQNVEGIGQEFADEIFRVFQKQNSNTILEAVNANLSVQFMIARVI